MFNSFKEYVLGGIMVAVLVIVFIDTFTAGLSELLTNVIAGI